MKTPPSETADLLRALFALGGERAALAVVTTSWIRPLPALGAWLAGTFGLVTVDVTEGGSLFTPVAELPRHRFLAGLSLLPPEERRRQVFALIRGRDRIGALGLQVVVWLLEEDLPFFHETAPDFASRVQEVLPWEPAALEPPGRDDLVLPIGTPGRPSRRLPVRVDRWLRGELGWVRGIAALSGTGEEALELALDFAWRSGEGGRGPVALVRLDRLDAARCGRWLRELGFCRLAVAWGGAPEPGVAGWPAMTPLLVAGVEADDIPRGVPSPPAELYREPEAGCDAGDAGGPRGADEAGGKLFLSHSHADKETAQALRRALEDRGVPVWEDVVELRVGDRLRWLEEAVRGARGLVLLWTPAAAEAEWVEREVGWALEEQARRPEYRVIVVLRGGGVRHLRLLLGEELLYVEATGAVEDAVPGILRGLGELPPVGRGKAAGDLAGAEPHLRASLDGLRASGRQDYLPRGLLARADYHLANADLPAARRDLAEARRVVTRCGLRVFEPELDRLEARLAAEEETP